MSTTGEHAITDRMTALEVALATLGATLGTKLDALIVTVASTHNDHETRIRGLEMRPHGDAELDDRVTKLERFWYLAAGAAIALGGGAGALVQVVTP